MSITKASLVTAINDELSTSFIAVTLSALIQRRLVKAMKWLSRQAKWSCLHTYDTKTLAAGESSVAKPDYFRIMDIIKVNDGTYDSRPLTRLAQGFTEYHRNIEDLTSGLYSEPLEFIEQGDNIYFSPVADKSYTVKIWYYAYNYDLDNILFPDELKEALELACIAAYLDGIGRHEKAQYYWQQAQIEAFENSQLIDRQMNFTKCRNL